jgi:hypothetical protein
MYPVVHIKAALRSIAVAALLPLVAASPVKVRDTYAVHVEEQGNSAWRNRIYYARKKNLIGPVNTPILLRFLLIS